MKERTIILTILLAVIFMFSCTSTPQPTLAKETEVLIKESKIDGYSFNLVIMTGETPDFSYPLEITKFFTDEIGNYISILKTTMLSGSNATLSNLITAIEPYRSSPNIISIIVYDGHAGSSEMVTAGETIPYQRFVDEIENNISSPTLVILGSCYSGNASKYLNTDTKIALFTSSPIELSSSSGSNNGVELSVLGSIIYALSSLEDVDNNNDGKITASELAARAMIVSDVNSENYGWYEGKKWANFGVYFWGADLILGEYQ